MTGPPGHGYGSADFAGEKARVAGEPAGNTVYSKKAEVINIGQAQMALADVNGVRALVAGETAMNDAVVYARSPENVSLGVVIVEKADFEAVKNIVGSGPVERLAQRIHGASGALN